jgi:hypothetical protein
LVVLLTILLHLAYAGGRVVLPLRGGEAVAVRTLPFNMSQASIPLLFAHGVRTGAVVRDDGAGIGDRRPLFQEALNRRGFNKNGRRRA